MVCSNWSEEIPSGTPWWFFNSVVFVLDHFSANLAITLLRQQVTSWSDFVVRSVLRSGHKFFTLLWRVSIACFHCHILFSFPRIVFSSGKFPTHTHFFPLPNLSRTVAVHRIRWCFETVGASKAEANPCCSSAERHQWHKWRRERRGWAPATVMVEKDV